MTNFGNPLAVNVTVPANPAAGVTVTVYVVPPSFAIVRDAGEAVSEKSPPTTVMVRVAGALDNPPLSVTVSEAVYVPALAYVTFPGAATELDAGFPPWNDHEYAAIVPSGSFPDPAKDTDPPALTVTFAEGFVIVAVGG